MYEKLKQLIKGLLPKRFLLLHEEVIRKILFIFYIGNKKQCNICEKKLNRFILLNNGEQMCPKCGSLGRNRRLMEILNSGLLKEGLTMLDFSPSRCLYRKFKNDKRINYSSTDFAGEFLADKKLNITKIEEPDEQYDLIICYHILEHIEDDRKAMKELYRILKKGGTCMIQTPFQQGEIYEDWTITSKEEREKYFGQNDHVRVYSVNGLKSRLENEGFKVEIKKYLENPNNLYGFKEEEYILKTDKPI